MAIRILLVDDHPLYRRYLRSLIEETPGLLLVAEAASGAAAIEVVRRLTPNLVVMDVAMPDMNGMTATRLIRAENPSTRVLALSMYAEARFVSEMFAAGAGGYVLKESDAGEITRSIASVAAGTLYLSAPLHRLVDSFLFPTRRDERNSIPGGSGPGADGDLAG